MKNKIETPEIAFIIGNGRTGTHMVGHFLDDSTSSKVCFEAAPLVRGNNATRQPHWTWIHALSKNPRVFYRWWPKVIDNLTRLKEKFSPLLFIDKSNQLMAWVEELIEVFPNAKFIGCTRDPIPVVRSMSQHGGFIADASGLMGYAESYEVPNLFSGAMDETFYKLDVLGRLTWRWAAARQRLMYLKRVLHPSQMTIVRYEEFVSSPKAREHLKEFLGVKTANDEMGITDRNKGAEEFFGPEYVKTIEEAIALYEDLHGSIESGRGPASNPSIRSIPPTKEKELCQNERKDSTSPSPSTEQD